MKKILFFLLLSNLAYPCEFKLNSNPTLTWTGYKFSEKSPVSGTFNDVEFKALANKDFSKFLKSISLSLDAFSFESKNKARNKNIVTSLFKKVVNGQMIKANVKAVRLEDKIIEVSLDWGNKTHTVSFPYSYENGKFEMAQSIDLIKLGHEKAYNSLKKACKVHHRGKDKKVVSWSEVKITVKANINHCQ